MENFRRFWEPVYRLQGKGSARRRWDFLAAHNLSQWFWQSTPGPWTTFPPPLPPSAWYCLQAAPSRGVQPGFSLDAVHNPGGTITLSVGASQSKLTPKRVPLTGAICGCPQPWALHQRHRWPARNNAGLSAPTRSPGSRRVAGERFRRFSPASFPRRPRHTLGSSPGVSSAGAPRWPLALHGQSGRGWAGHGHCHMAAP